MIKIVEKKGKEKEKYPYLGVTNAGNVVLFTSSETGTLLKQGDKRSLYPGLWSNNWIEKDFEEYKGILSLENM